MKKPGVFSPLPPHTSVAPPVLPPVPMPAPPPPPPPLCLSLLYRTGLRQNWSNQDPTGEGGGGCSELILDHFMLLYYYYICHHSLTVFSL